MSTKARISALVFGILIAPLIVGFLDQGLRGVLDQGLRPGAERPPLGVVLAAEDPPGTPSSPPPAGSFGMPEIENRPQKELSLRGAIETALESNLNVSIRRKDYESADWAITLEEATFDPLLAAGADYVKSKDEPLSDFASQGRKSWNGSLSLSQVLEQGFNYSATWTSAKDRTLYVPAAFQLPFFDPASPTYLSGLNIQLGQPLLRNFGFKANQTGIEIARLSLNSTEENFRLTLLTTLSEVSKAYWDLGAAINNLEVQKTGLKLANDLLTLNKKKVEVGTLAPIQITEAEASVANREQGVILAEASIRNAEDQLRRIMNVDPEAPDWDMAIKPTDELPFEIESINEAEMINTALTRRPEIMQATNELHVNELQHRYEENQKKPQLDAVAQFAPRGNNYEPGDFESGDFNGDGTIEQRVKLAGWGDSASEVFGNDIYDWSVGVRFSIPIGNRAGKAREARSRIAYEQSGLSLEDLKRGVRVEVRTAVLAVETFRRSVEAARVNVTLQRKKLDAEQKRYDNGMSTSFQVLTFQNDLTAALSDEIRAIVAYNKALVELGRVTATLPERNGITLAAPTQGE